MFLLPGSQHLLEPRVPLRPGVVVRREPAAVDPGGAALQGDDAWPFGRAARGRGTRTGRSCGWPCITSSSQRLRDVQVVVRLVQQQHLVRAAQERLEHQPLLLAAGQGADRAPLRTVVRHPECGRRAHIPQDFDVVAAGIRPLGQRRRVAQLGGFVVPLHHRQFGRVEGSRSGTDPGRRGGHEQVSYRRIVAHRPDELSHHADAATARHDTAGGAASRHDPQQRRLADPFAPTSATFARSPTRKETS